MNNFIEGFKQGYILWVSIPNTEVAGFATGFAASFLTVGVIICIVAYISYKYKKTWWN